MRSARTPKPKAAPQPSECQRGKQDTEHECLIFTLPWDCPARLHLEDLEHPEDFRRRLAEWLLRQR